MPGGILLLDHPPGSFENLAARLRSEIFPVQICRTPEQLLAAIEKEKPELLIAAGDFPEITAPQLAEQVYGKLSIPIILVLSTAGEETQTFLRRHPAVIGVYYRPLNIEKILDRIRRFFNRQEP
jgi:DNA-binding response OmpR family regulator